VSDGHLAVQERKLAALGLAGYFDAIVWSDEWGRGAWNPSPRPFEVVLARLGVDAARAIYVADNVTKDFLGARRWGMATIWVRRPGGEYASRDPPHPGTCRRPHDPRTCHGPVGAGRSRGLALRASRPLTLAGS
jgi:FMN phosphatase YigB (HAD superfamily)